MSDSPVWFAVSFCVTGAGHKRRSALRSRPVGLLSPKMPPYDPLEWEAMAMGPKAKAVCQSWALQGYGTPLAVFGAYALKIALYVGGWLLACWLSPQLGSPLEIERWWSHPVAFEKAIVWSLLFEIVGLGCGSGPLTGRYLPPVGGALYFLRRKTTKLPLFAGAPIIGGQTRSWIDVAAYAATLVTLGLTLWADAPGFGHWLALGLLVALLGVLDKTLFLAARAEHYWVTVICFAFAPQPLAAAMAVQLALWFFAGVSKLNHHFPTVVCVMNSNGPFTFPALRKRMYRAYPEDLRPSGLAVVAGHAGTALELGVPVLLAIGAGPGGETITLVGLALMVALHLYITGNVPMGVPLEWNVLVVYGGFVLFGAHGDLSPFSLDALGPGVAVFLAVMLLGLPIAGNLVPRAISFLLSMRYYAGNWACSVWLFRGDAHRRLEQLTASAPWVEDQLAKLYDRPTTVALIGKVMAFRLMHLHGRALRSLVPRALHGAGEFGEYRWVDGEIVAGLALGWNFGEGHLHNEQLLASLQAQCGFEPGELRCIFIESQPLHRQRLEWRIADAASGPIDSGEIEVSELREGQPWDVQDVQEPVESSAV